MILEIKQEALSELRQRNRYQIVISCKDGGAFNLLVRLHTCSLHHTWYYGSQSRDFVPQLMLFRCYCKIFQPQLFFRWSLWMLLWRSGSPPQNFVPQLMLFGCCCETSCHNSFDGAAEFSTTTGCSFDSFDGQFFPLIIVGPSLELFWPTLNLDH